MKKVIRQAGIEPATHGLEGSACKPTKTAQLQARPADSIRRESRGDTRKSARFHGSTESVTALAALPVLPDCASAPAYADAGALVALIVLAVGLYVAAETR